MKYQKHLLQDWRVDGGGKCFHQCKEIGRRSGKSSLLFIIIIIISFIITFINHRYHYQFCHHYQYHKLGDRASIWENSSFSIIFISTLGVLRSKIYITINILSTQLKHDHQYWPCQILQGGVVQDRGEALGNWAKLVTSTMMIHEWAICWSTCV